jgi:hypothetical protein
MNVNALKSIIINLKLKHKKVIEIYAKSLFGNTSTLGWTFKNMRQCRVHNMCTTIVPW